MVKKLTTVIMAAGKGSRMKNPERSKVMHELHGKPLIQFVVELALKVDSETIITVVGHQKQSIIDFLNSKFSGNISKLKFAHQDEQLGTGHAIMQTKLILENFHGNVLILSGDVPLLKYETVLSFLKFHKDNNFDASLISAILDDPSGYGRVLRDSENNFCDIREEKDCNEEEKKCTEINSGIYITDSKILFSALDTLKTDNAQGEYYLTDIFKYFKSAGKTIGALPVNDLTEISGVNSVEQLEELENSIQKI
ncbi:MAG: sugar phosphate nucleotidyltransferase [bacterium]